MAHDSHDSDSVAVVGTPTSLDGFMKLFSGEIRRRFSGGDAATIAEGTLRESAEEIIEKRGWRRLNLSEWLTRPDWIGTASRAVAQMDEDVRLVTIMALAAYVDGSSQVTWPKWLKVVVSTVLRSLPAAIPDMFRPRVEDVASHHEADEVQIKDAMTKAFSDVGGNRILYVGNLQTDVIHDAHWHPPREDQAIIKGDMTQILMQFGARQPLCPICFPEEWNQREIRVISAEPEGDHSSEGESESESTVLQLIAGIEDDDDRMFLLNLYRMAIQEQETDRGLLEGRAFKLGNEIAKGVKNDLEALVNLIPENPPDLEPFLRPIPPRDRRQDPNWFQLVLTAPWRWWRGPMPEPEAPIVRRLDDRTEAFIAALFLAHAGEHPLGDATVAVQDKLDAFWSSLPRDMQQERGLRGLERWYQDIRPFTLMWWISRPLMGMLMVLYLVGLFALVGAFVATVAGVLSLIGISLSTVVTGIISLVMVVLVIGYSCLSFMSVFGLAVEGMLWLVILGRIGAVLMDIPFRTVASFWRKPEEPKKVAVVTVESDAHGDHGHDKHGKDDHTKTDMVVITNRVEPVRRPALTISVVVALVGLIVTPLLWAFGQIYDISITFVIMSLWAIVLVAEITNKFAAYVTEIMKFRGVKMALGAAQVVFIGCLLIGLTLAMFMGDTRREQVANLGTGVTEKVLRATGEATKVAIDKEQQQCFDSRELANDDYCQAHADLWPCDCSGMKPKSTRQQCEDAHTNYEQKSSGYCARNPTKLVCNCAIIPEPTAWEGVAQQLANTQAD